MKKLVNAGAVATLTALATTPAIAEEEENASNPLAAVNNNDFRFQYFDLGGADRWDSWIDGAYMLTPKFKLKYELHYWETNVTGSSDSGFETFHLKPLYFPTQGTWGDWKWKSVIGAEWIVGFGNEDDGIGFGSDQVAGLTGLSFSKGGTVVVPLIQHFLSYDGPSVNDTSMRLIVIQSLPNDCWAKIDTKVPIQWDNDHAVPAIIETQLGKTFSPAFGMYVDGMVGIGGDKPYEWGTGLGFRLKY